MASGLGANLFRRRRSRHLALYKMLTRMVAARSVGCEGYVCSAVVLCSFNWERRMLGRDGE